MKIFLVSITIAVLLLPCFGSVAFATEDDAVKDEKNVKSVLHAETGVVKSSEASPGEFSYRIEIVGPNGQKRLFKSGDASEVKEIVKGFPLKAHHILEKIKSGKFNGVPGQVVVIGNRTVVDDSKLKEVNRERLDRIPAEVRKRIQEVMEDTVHQHNIEVDGGRVIIVPADGSVKELKLGMILKRLDKLEADISELKEGH